MLSGLSTRRFHLSVPSDDFSDYSTATKSTGLGRTFNSLHRSRSADHLPSHVNRTTESDASDYIYYKDKSRSGPIISRTNSARRIVIIIGILLLLLFFIPIFRRSFPPSSNMDAENSSVDDSSLPPAPVSITGKEDIVLYRIIGNDLPPRHKPGQTLSNLRFILENEPDLPRAKKYFILNRIADPAVERVVVMLLNRHGQDFVKIPFDEEEYMKKDYRLEDFTQPDFFHSGEYMRFSKVGKLRTIDYTFSEKNLYAMNNNGGRNAALEHARAHTSARWIMPFDGNCFLTTNAWLEILRGIDSHGHDHAYFMIPMSRLLNNSILLDNSDERPRSPEEPQIVFRRDAKEHYNSGMRYGRRSKLELLWRLGVVDNRKAASKQGMPWEIQERDGLAPESGNFKTVGWVFRLFSGQAAQEENHKEAAAIRAFNRLLAIQDFLEGLDERLTREKRGFRQENLLIYGEDELAETRVRYWSRDLEAVKAVEILKKRADKIMETVMDGYVVDENSLVKGGLQGSYQGKKTHGHFLKAPFMNLTSDSDGTARRAAISPVPLDQLFENVTVLTLAHYFTAQDPYGRWAANLVRVHLLNELAVDNAPDDKYHPSSSQVDDNVEFLLDQGYSFPSLNRVPRVIPRFNGNSPSTDGTTPIPPDLLTTDVSFFLDAARLLHRAHALTHKELVDLRSIASDYLEHLVNSPAGIHRAQMRDHRAALYDIQVATLAAFTDDLRLHLRVVARCRMRVAAHFRLDGTQPSTEDLVRVVLEQAGAGPSGALAGKDGLSTRRALDFHHATLTLQYWLLLARAIQNSVSSSSYDLWSYVAPKPRPASLETAVVSHAALYSGRVKDDPAHYHRLSSLVCLARMVDRASPKGGGRASVVLNNLVNEGLNCTADEITNLEENALRNDQDVPHNERLRRIWEETRGKGVDVGIPPFLWMLGGDRVEVDVSR